MAPTATTDELRNAYRKLARHHHPDARGDSGADAMAAINEAWHVLGDPSRRAAYDETLWPRSSLPREPAAGPVMVDGVAQNDGAWTDDVLEDPVPAGHVGRWGIPLLWVVALVVVAAIFVFTAYAAGDKSQPDDRLEPGACVVTEPEGYARRVPCSSAHDGVVQGGVASDAPCPDGSSAYIGRPDMERVCVR